MKTPNGHLTPSELLDQFPQLKEHFTVQDIGRLVTLNILRSRVDRNKKTVYVGLESVRRLLEFINRNIEASKIDPGQIDDYLGNL